MEFGILGPLEVRDGDRRIHVGGRNRRALLALLLLRANELVSTEHLIDELYGEQPPKTATQSVHNAISHLRRALGRDVLETNPTGYVLRIDPESFDLTRFQALVARAREVIGAERASLLHEALSLWRGGALADLADEPFAQTEILQLEEARLAAVEERIDADLELGRHADIVGELEALVARNPLRERLRRQLMLALYRSGRQADALAAYQDARRVLVDELGLEPSAELQELERAVLQQDPALRVAATAASPVAPAGGRRKTVTVLFCDLVDSTKLGEQLDPEVLHAVLSRYFEAMLAVLERHGGTVEKFIGDAVVAVFGIPVTHEDDAVRAVRAALEMRAALDSINEEFEGELGVRLRARTGVNTGEVFTAPGASGSLTAGDPGNVAARLEEAARAGEIVIGQTTHRLVRDAVVAEPLEPVSAKGKQAAVDAYRVVELAPRVAGRARRFDTPMVGRARELDELRDAFEAAVAERAPRLFTVVGAAGVGKSRLAGEFVTRLGAESRILRGRCLPYGEGISFWPVIEAVKQAADVTESTPSDEVRARTEALVAGEDGEQLISSRLSQLLGVDGGTASSDELAWAVRRLFEALARRRPLVLVFDDIHWAEPVFLDLLELVARSSAGVSILIVCLARLELLEGRPEWGADGLGVRLTPLDEDESERLVENLLGGTVEARAQAKIRAAAEGNPLYVEELVAMLIDDGLLRRQNGGWVPTDDLTALAVPPTIGALLAARLDGLADDERSALEVASIEGQVFHAGAVAELVDESERPAMSRALNGLVHKGLVRPARANFAGEEAFRFRHLLIRDAAYGALPKRRRADLHERFAAWLDERAADRLAEQDAIVGYHLEQAYRYGSEMGRPDDGLGSAAGQRLGSAGIHTLKRADFRAAVDLLGRATSLLPDTDAFQIEARCELALAVRAAGDTARALGLLDQAALAAAAVGDRRLELRARIEHANVRLQSDPEATGAELAQIVSAAIPVFEERQDHRSLGRAWILLGDQRGGIECRNADWADAAERALHHYHRAGWRPSICYVKLAAALLHGPVPAPKAIRRCRELLIEAEGDRYAEAGVSVCLAGLVAQRGSFGDARALIEGARAAYRELRQTPHVTSICDAILARVEILAGDWAAAEDASRKTCEVYVDLGERNHLATAAAKLGDAVYAQGRYTEAAEWVRTAEACASSDDISAQIAWRVVRIKLLAQGGAFEDADALAAAARALAARTDALNLHADVWLSTAEAHRVAERPDDAAIAVREALKLFEAKGNVAAAERARNLLLKAPAG